MPTRISVRAITCCDCATQEPMDLRILHRLYEKVRTSRNDHWRMVSRSPILPRCSPPGGCCDYEWSTPAAHSSRRLPYVMRHSSPTSTGSAIRPPRASAFAPDDSCPPTASASRITTCTRAWLRSRSQRSSLWRRSQRHDRRWPADAAFRQAGSRRRFWTRVDANSAPAPSSALFQGSSAPCTGACGSRIPGIFGNRLFSSRALLGAGSRSALPLRF